MNSRNFLFFPFVHSCYLQWKVSIGNEICFYAIFQNHLFPECITHSSRETKANILIYLSNTCARIFSIKSIQPLINFSLFPSLPNSIEFEKPNGFHEFHKAFMNVKMKYSVLKTCTFFRAKLRHTIINNFQWNLNGGE